MASRVRATANSGASKRQPSRPNLSLSLDQMRARARANSGDKTIIEGILDELENHRSTTAAKKLAQAIRSGESLDAPSVKPSDDGTSGRHDPVEALPVFDGCKDLKARYDLLLGTFSERGEILARWGITDALPDDMKEHIAVIWSKRVTDEEDFAGRSTEKLCHDMKTVGITISVPTTRRTKTNAE